MKKIFTLCAVLVSALTLSAEEATPLTCAEAAEQALALGENETGTTLVAVTGYITNTNGTVSREQQTFWMDDEKGTTQTLQAYWANLPEDDKETPLAVGDKIVLTGYLLHYVNSAGTSHIAEIKNGNVTVLDRTIAKMDTIEVNTCEAIEEGEILNAGEFSDDIFEVSGVVASVTSTNDTYHSQTFQMICEENEKAFEAYNCTILDEGYVALGDTVLVRGKLQNYNNSKIEIASGKVEIIAKGDIKTNTYEVTVAEALAAAQALANSAVSADTYVITGYVDSISSAYSEQYDNISFYLCDDLAAPAYEFQCYRVKGGKDITLGAKVVVTGNLTHYYKAATEEKPEVHGYQTNAGATYEIVGGEEGILNTNMNVKSVKTIENGSLIILMDGKRYNTLGAEL